MDKLKQYLQDNSGGLDVNQPGDEVWDNIRNAVDTPAQRVVMHPARKNKAWWYAAAASVMLLSFAGWKWLTPETGTESIALASAPVPQENNRNMAMVSAPPVTTAATTQQPIAKQQMVDPYELLGSYSNNYRQLVKLQMKSIRRTPVLAEDPAYFEDFRSTLAQMERDEKNIRSVIRKQGISEELIEQLIGLYQQKLDVLKTLQAEINKLNNRARQGQPGKDSLGGYYLNI